MCRLQPEAQRTVSSNHASVMTSESGCVGAVKGTALALSKGLHLMARRVAKGPQMRRIRKTFSPPICPGGARNDLLHGHGCTCVFPLSLRNVDEPLIQRGIDLYHEALVLLESHWPDGSSQLLPFQGQRAPNA
jgi:hypothetical protein